jgi:hypothetical protein
MAGRIRTIKPELLEDEHAAGLSHMGWRLWVSCLLLADDYGNLRAAPAWLAGQVFWGVSRESPESVAGVLEELATCKRGRSEGSGADGLILLYSVRGQQYLHITGWHHQRIDKPGKPRCPTPDQADTEIPRESPARVPRESRESPADIRGSLAPDLRPVPPISTSERRAETDAAPPAPRLWPAAIGALPDLEAAAAEWGWGVALTSRDIGRAQRILGAGPIQKHEIDAAKAKAKGVAHFLGIVEGQRTDAAEEAAKPSPGPRAPAAHPFANSPIYQPMFPDRDAQGDNS